ncbi:hypothetical protein WKI68_17330 [Streptomyces sp. MS1.HAVA.3]|uniref:Uncharacterized protein n=1 Tax=Streptomyces caledonius TaxID=3134107 RepID=A0ABU8U6B5_9ACTN
MRRRIFGTAATTVVLGLLIPLAGCGGSGDGAGDSSTLRLVAAEYGNSPATSSKPFWDKMATDFTKEHPASSSTSSSCRGPTSTARSPVW